VQKKCAVGEYLWDPDSATCECKSKESTCASVGDIQKISVKRKHNDEHPAEWIFGFQDEKSGDPIRSAAILKQTSPCLYKAQQLCFQNYKNQLPVGENFGIKSQRENGEYKYIDTCIAVALESSADLSLIHTTKRDERGAQKDWISGADPRYVDHSCRPVPQWKQSLIDELDCSSIKSFSFNELTSPVSLLWAPEAHLPSIHSRSRFPLNPSERGKWFSWRASGLTPLIVWDPESSGSITEAAQLFGNYSWGKTWKNGYEALASLDTDKNGWLENTELKNISLWFDFNQDGVSDAGEVKSLSSVHVEALGVRPSGGLDVKKGMIVAENGFRRRIKGKIVTGGSVDWFSEAEEGHFGTEALHPPVPEELRKTSNPGADPSKGVAGMWIWSTIDTSGSELPENLPNGQFILYHDDSSIKGAAYVTSRLAPNQSGLAEAISRHAINGKVRQTAGGTIVVDFNTVSAAGGKVSSEARLSKDGTTMTGYTREESGAGREIVKYGWVASRLALNGGEKN